MENITEEIEPRLKALNKHLAARASLYGVVNRIDHIEITIAELKRVHAATGEG